MMRASAPTVPVAKDPLGPLTELQGTWVGKGFNLIALPTFDKSVNKFRLKLNATTETLKFESIGGPIPNRGNLQPDVNLFGVHYLQSVDDANGEGALHLEPGIFLNVPPTTVPPVKTNTIVRMATIPHGDSLLAQGDGFEVNGGPVIDIADSTPFTLGPKGNRINDTNPAYLAQYTNPILPPNIPIEAVANPNVLLTNAIKGQKIIKTVVLRVHATPVGGINGTPVTAKPGDVGGIVNIPFVVSNANANSMSSIFWIETVQEKGGNKFMQLQYTQTVILDFPVPGPNGKPVDIKWPHISVATLIKR